MTCVSLMAIDDTVRCDGVNLRPMGDGACYLAGVARRKSTTARGAPEALLGARATIRFADLIAPPGLRVENSGEIDSGAAVAPADGDNRCSSAVAQQAIPVFVPRGYSTALK